MSTTANTTFKIIITKFYVPIVTLSSKDNIKLVNLLDEALKRPVYWNYYKTKIESKSLDNNNLTRFPLDASFQGVRRYQYLKDHYQLIAVDFSKQKELGADSRAIQQIELYGMLRTDSEVYTVLEKSKETKLEFHKGIANVLWLNINGEIQ